MVLMVGLYTWKMPRFYPHAINMFVVFINNSAVTAYAGTSVYFATTPRIQYSQCRMSLNINDVSSLATNITIIPDNNSSTTHSIFPGQSILINISITDFFGFPSSCTADVYLICDNKLNTCFDKQMKLIGPESVVLTQTANTSSSTVDTNLKLSSPEGHVNSSTVTLELRCTDAEYTGDKIPLNITPCPLGFLYNPKESVCEYEAGNPYFICSTKFGAVCVSHGYWYGAYTTNNTVVQSVGRCSCPECRYSYDLCPPEVQKKGKFSLHGFDVDRQCSEGRGGILCASCACTCRI